MKTEALIDLVSQDRQAEDAVGARQWALWLGGGAALSALVLATVIGVRPDYAAVIGQPLVALKQLLPASVLALSLPWVIACQRPESSPAGGLRWLSLAAALGLGIAGWALWQTEPGGRLAAARGASLVPCLLLISALSLPILSAMIAVLRRGAPTDPGRTGLLAGLAAGCAATVIYALHCNEDNPAFYGLWYTTGVLMSGAIGHWSGRRWLRW